MATRTEIRMPGTPPVWVNAMMRRALRTPLLQRLVGRQFTIMTVTGAKTGKRYSTPVQYMRLEGELVVLSQVTRTWWRNVRTNPAVELRVAGRDVHGDAHVAEGAEAIETLGRCLADTPRVARFYGLEADATGRYDEDDLAALLERVVVLVVRPARP